jgi:predicted transcriptional regulator
MARNPSKNLTERELEIMHVLWSLGQARLGEIQSALNQSSGDSVAPSTVSTQLSLLINKGFVTQSGRFGRSIYSPTCTREEATRDLFDDFRARVGLGGRAPAFLIQLLKAETLTEADREALKEILRESAQDAPAAPDGKQPPAEE